MNYKSLFQDLLHDPLNIYIKSLTRINNGLVWHRFSNLCKKNGLEKSKFILSFDCDTEKDIEVALEVNKRLVDYGITPVYAVPGELLEKGAKTYEKIRQTGCEFINHGYLEHTVLKNNKYISTLFYDKLSLNEVKQDISKGDSTLRKVLGVEPNGFRVPHFGTFNSAQQINFLHGFLESLNYKFSTSTMPIWGLKHGPAIKNKKSKIVEIPLTGAFSTPFNLLDSWGARFAENRSITEAQYGEEISNYLQFSEKNSIFINIYADPSQVYDWDDFFKSMRTIAKYNCPSYEHFLESLNTK